LRILAGILSDRPLSSHTSNVAAHLAWDHGSA
jgi:hypothetical protein